MKTLITCFISLFLLNSYSFSQTSLENEKGTSKLLKFKLTVFENSKDGRKYKIYTFAKRQLHIYDKPFPTQNYKEHIYTKHKFNSKELFREISKLNLDTLKEVYSNNCVDTNNGYDFSIVIESKSMTISTTLHHYYIKQVDDLISLLNKYLPLTFQIEYLTKETKQDCNKQN